MWFMEKQTQIKGIEVHHNGLLFPRCPIIVSRELQIAILIKPLFLSASRDIIEDIHLRGYLAMV